MKKALLLTVLTLPLFLSAQISPNHPDYDEMKQSGQIQTYTQGAEMPDVPAPGSAFSMDKSSGFFVELDETFIQSMSPNDDASVGPIDLGFTFCFYGEEYTQVYINNNGNLSFGESYYQYLTSGFPSSDYIMIAPFWGDVDTRA